MTTEELYIRTKELIGQHRWEEVVDELDDQTLRNSKSWKLYWNTGWSNFKLNQLSSAKKYFEQAIKLTTNSKDQSVCLTFLGISELEDKCLDKACEKLNEALNLRDSTLTRKSLALALMHLNEIDSAENIHLDGISNEPNNKERLAAYGDFLLDIERTEDAEVIKQKINELE